MIGCQKGRNIWWMLSPSWSPHSLPLMLYTRVKIPVPCRTCWFHSSVDLERTRKDWFLQRNTLSQDKNLAAIIVRWLKTSEITPLPSTRAPSRGKICSSLYWSMRRIGKGFAVLLITSPRLCNAGLESGTINTWEVLSNVCFEIPFFGPRSSRTLTIQGSQNPKFSVM